MAEFTTYDKQSIDEKFDTIFGIAGLNAARISELEARVAALESGPPAHTPRFPGDPKPGTVYWGCTQNNNGEPTQHETATGRPITLRRTFFQWKDRQSKIADLLDNDSANGRLSWVSVKTDGQFTKPQSEIDQLYTTLDQANPVWLSVWHEPENDGINPADWRTLQTLFSDRPANVAFAPIHMSYTHRSTSGRNPADWWVDGLFDFLGLDHYAKNQGVPLVNNTQWTPALAFAKSRGVPLAVGEWGTKTQGAEGAGFIRDFFTTGVEDDSVVGFSCYDSPGGGDGPWNLTGELLGEFRAIMGEPEVAHL